MTLRGISRDTDASCPTEECDMRPKDRTTTTAAARAATNGTCDSSNAGRMPIAVATPVAAQSFVRSAVAQPWRVAMPTSVTSGAATRRRGPARPTSVLVGIGWMVVDYGYDRDVMPHFAPPTYPPPRARPAAEPYIATDGGREGYCERVERRRGAARPPLRAGSRNRFPPPPVPLILSHCDDDAPVGSIGDRSARRRMGSG